MAKWLLSLFLWIIFGIIGLFALHKKAYLIPKPKIQWIPYTNQSEFQWISNYQYYYQKQTFQLDPGYQYSFSLLPIGYVRFQKTGNEIEFFLPSNQLFWKRKSSAYPYMEPYGNFILSINADRTQINVMDLNGNLIYKINGTFLVDIQCQQSNTESECFLLFNKGKIVFFNKKNIFEFFLEQEHTFYKSLSIYNHQIAVHYLKDNQDYFDIYSIQKDKKKLTLIKSHRFKSSVIFPYTIPFLFSKYAIVFPNFQEVIVIKEKNTKKYSFKKDNWKKQPLKKQQQITISTNFIGNCFSYHKFFLIIFKTHLSFFSYYGNPILRFHFQKDQKGYFFFYKNIIYLFTKEGILKITFSEI